MEIRLILSYVLDIFLYQILYEQHLNGSIFAPSCKLHIAARSLHRVSREDHLVAQNRSSDSRDRLRVAMSGRVPTRSLQLPALKQT